MDIYNHDYNIWVWTRDDDGRQILVDHETRGTWGKMMELVGNIIINTPFDFTVVKDGRDVMRDIIEADKH